MKVPVKYNHATENGYTEYTSNINIYSDSDTHPMYYSYPVTFSNKSGDIKVKVTLNSCHVSARDVEITCEDENKHIQSVSYENVAKALDDYMDRATR